MAHSTCHGVTGRDWSIQMLFPSSETDGAAIRFMDARKHRSIHSTNVGAPRVPDRSASKSETRACPLNSSTMPPATSIKMPRPQLSI